MTRFSVSAFALAPALAFALPAGYTVSNWAEPFDIEYPTALSAAADGTVYVSVDRNGSLGKLPDMGKIVSCKDTDGDGKADTFADFVPNVDSPRGGHFVRDTLYLIHPPFLSSFRDTTGDGVADEHKVLLENIGFGLRHPRGSDHTTNGCRMGIDGWLYIAVGDFGMEATKGTDGRVVTLHGGGVARVRPDGTDLEVYSYHTRNICDVAISPTLDLFTRDNTNDGKGWNIRVHHLTNGSEHGYPRLYKNFTDEAVTPLLDLGGGSGTGALYLAEPGYDEMLLTCDWTTGKIYHDQLQKDGASYSLEEEVFLDLTRAIDIDVDGSSNLYVCDWRGGGFKFGGKGKKVGMVQKLTKEGVKGKPFPDLTTMKLPALVGQLKSASAVRRLEASREILARGDDAVVPALKALMSNRKLSLESRIAAIFTLSQLGEPGGKNFVSLTEEPWSGQPEIHEYLVRALGDIGGKSLDEAVPAIKMALVSWNPRACLQGVIALGRAENPGNGAAEAILKAAAKAEDPRISNTAIRSLVSIGDIDTLLAHSDKALARLALMRIHTPEAVSGVSAKLLQTAGSERMGLIEVLARLFHREAKWDLKSWWGTRPDDRGPYFTPETWEETANIKAALEGVFTKLSGKEQSTMLGLLGRNRIAISELNLGHQDPLSIALATPTPDQTQINLLTAAAKDLKRPWDERVGAYRALGRVENGTVARQVEVLGAWIDQAIDAGELERELSDFVNQPALILSTKDLRRVAAKGSKSESRVAWRTLLTFTQSPLIKENQKKPILKMIKENPREEGLFLALADLLLPGFEEQIENAINSDNDTLIETAQKAQKAIAAAKASAGKTLSELKPEEVMKVAMTVQGDPKLGEKLYTRQGCIACHAVDQKALQKGPYLGSAGSKFTKDYLIESILDPNAVVSQGFQTEMITMKDGTVHLGFVTRQEDGVIDLRNIAGLVTKLKEAEIKQREIQKMSMMPPGLGAGLTMEEFNNLVAYLVSMKE